MERVHRIAELPKLSVISLTDRKNHSEPTFHRTFQEVFVESLSRISENWLNSERQIDRQIPGLPKEIRGMFSLQRSIHGLQLQSELLARAADAIGSSVRRIQQLGNG